MNGAVVGAMESRGIIYPLNYGVSIPTILRVADRYSPDHELALNLYQSDVRELMLAALFIDDPSEVTREQMYTWSAKFTNHEIVENTVSVLFSKSVHAVEVSLDWIGSEKKILCYAGLLMAAGALRINQKVTGMAVGELIDAAGKIPYRSSFDLDLSHGVVTLLERCARHSADACRKVTALGNSFNDTRSKIICHTGEELRWRIETT